MWQALLVRPWMESIGTIMRFTRMCGTNWIICQRITRKTAKRNLLKDAKGLSWMLARKLHLMLRAFGRLRTVRRIGSWFQSYRTGLLLAVTESLCSFQHITRSRDSLHSCNVLLCSSFFWNEVFEKRNLRNTKENRFFAHLFGFTIFEPFPTDVLMWINALLQPLKRAWRDQWVLCCSWFDGSVTDPLNHNVRWIGFILKTVIPHENKISCEIIYKEKR